MSVDFNVLVEVHTKADMFTCTAVQTFVAPDTVYVDAGATCDAGEVLSCCSCGIGVM